MRIPEQWTFQSPEVAGAFDEHVREQLPWYDLVTDAVVQIARHYIGQGGLVYDIGSANGNVGRALRSILDTRRADFVAIDSSPEMVDSYDGPGSVLVGDAETFDYQPYDLAVSMLTLMFLRPSEVPALLDRLQCAIRPGGALLIIERTLPPGGYPSIITSRLTLAAKAAAGASAEQIVAKELSLAGVQRPIAASLLTSRGAVEWFRFGDFAGYLIEGEAS